jgi:demethoxyubiquinone hydroxylase (CLK1/Coq7/Cat5 family)
MALSHADRILKVNHAGEHGAVNIYRGQRLACCWRDAALKRELEEFRARITIARRRNPGRESSGRACCGRR